MIAAPMSLQSGWRYLAEIPPLKKKICLIIKVPKFLNDIWLLLTWTSWSVPQKMQFVF